MKLKLAALLLLCLFCVCPALGEEDEIPLVYSRVVDVPGVGEWMYYAQNDPLWAQSIYEPKTSKKWRLFGESGCGPTAAAIAVSRYVPQEGLDEILNHVNPYWDGYRYCPCSINYYRCDRTHTHSTLTQAEEIYERLPVTLAIFATGNNEKRTKYRSEADGTSLELFKAVADVYGLRYSGSRHWEDAVQALREGYSIVTTVTRGVFTQVSHYLVLANIDDTYLYILDPNMRESYPADRNGLLDVLEPGLVRVRLEDVSRLRLSGFYMIGKPIEEN